MPDRPIDPPPAPLPPDPPDEPVNPQAALDSDATGPRAWTSSSSGEIIHWRGPSPFHFVTVPEEQSAAIEAVSSLVTYGWGAIPVKARIGRTDFTTSLFPRGELYLVPVKVAVRRAEDLALGDEVTVHLRLDA